MREGRTAVVDDILRSTCTEDLDGSSLSFGLGKGINLYFYESFESMHGGGR